MSPAERKFIHKTLKDIGGIKTESRGQDKGRHVVVEPTNPRPGGARGGGGGRGRGRAGGGQQGGGYEGVPGRKGGARAPVTEEQRQLLYGRLQAAKEEAEGDFEDHEIEERSSLLPEYRENLAEGSAPGGEDLLDDRIE